MSKIKNGADQRGEPGVAKCHAPAHVRGERYGCGKALRDTTKLVIEITMRKVRVLRGEEAAQAQGY